MRITLVAKSRVPCKGYGGTERQVDWLAAELVRLGHKVVLIAAPGSKHPMCGTHCAASEAECRSAISPNSDIVHFHGWYLDVARPALNTQHGLAPNLVRDSQYTLTVAALYGAFTGVFVGRAMRLWKLALRPAGRVAASGA